MFLVDNVLEFTINVLVLGIIQNCFHILELPLCLGEIKQSKEKRHFIYTTS